MSTYGSSSALVLHEIGSPLELEEITLAPLQANEVVVEIHATGICHTEIGRAHV